MSGGRPRSPFRRILGATWGPWRQLAACRDVDPDVFFPLGSDPADAAEARAVCAGCPVSEECLEAHLLEPHGIFGGHSEDERRRLAAQRRAS